MTGHRILSSKSSNVLRDMDIRSTLITDLKDCHAETTSRVVGELDILLGEVRIDVAVVNSSLLGYEIKSGADTLDRLPRQLEAYAKVFDMLTLVVAERHLAAARRITPRWWGLTGAGGTRNAVHLEVIREPRRNYLVEPTALAQLLWRSELVQLLQPTCQAARLASMTRRAMCDLASATLSAGVLAEGVRECIKARRDWRVDRPRSPDGDSCQPVAMSWHFPVRHCRARSL